MGRRKASSPEPKPGTDPEHKKGRISVRVDDRQQAMLDLLKERLFQAGQIPENAYNAAITYMTDHYLEAVKTQNNGSNALPLDVDHRVKLELIRKAIRAAGRQDIAASDLEMVKLLIELEHERLAKSDGYLATFVQWLRSSKS